VLVLIAAVVIASAIEPFTKWFVRYKIPRVLAVLLIYLILIVGLSGFLFFFLPPLLSDTVSALGTLSSFVESFSVPSQFDSGIPSDGIVGKLSKGFSVENVLTEVRGFISTFSGGLLQSVSVIFGGLFSFVLIIVLSFYLTVQENGIKNFLRLITPLRHEHYVIDLWKRSQHKIGLWMQGQLLLGLIVGVLVFLGLTILGVKHALLLAVIAAMFELIPLFGPKFAAVPAILVGFFDSITLGFMVFGLYMIIDQFENHLIYPLVVRKVIGISPIIVILALIVGGKLAGFLGIILAVPLMTVLMEFLNDIEREKANLAQKGT